MPGHWTRRVIGCQAVYYGVTGLWPLVHLPSFEAVTGPKTDDWLVHMVGLLAAVIGAALGTAAAYDRARAAEVMALAVGSALAFAGIDLWYGLHGRISPIYLADSVVQVALIIVLGATWRIGR
jgi:ABC-type dipeptide/oligopeptide/nickel transport system permease subunit